MKQFTFRLLIFSLLATLCCSAFSSTAQAQSQKQATLFEAIKALNAKAVRAALEEGADPRVIKEIGGLSPIQWTVMQIGLFNLINKSAISLQEVEEKIIAVLGVLFHAGGKIYKHEPILNDPAGRGTLKLAKFLLDRGANPNAVDRDRGSSPIVAAYKGGHTEMVELLVQHGATPLAPTVIPQLRLLGAAERGDIPAMTQALENGGTVNGRPPGGGTALSYAAIFGGLAAVEFLLSKGADPNLPGDFPNLMPTLPLHLAVFKNKERFGESGDGDEIIQILIDAGAKVSSKGFQGKTPLHIAAEYNNDIAVKILLDAGADSEVKDDTGKTPLDYATFSQVRNLLQSYGGGGLMRRLTGGVKQQQAEVFPQTGHRAVVAVAFSPDGRQIVSVGADHTLKLWEIESGRQLRTFVVEYLNPWVPLAFSPDGRYVASGGPGATLKVWESATGRERLSIEGGRLGFGFPLSVAFSPDSRFILTSGVEDIKLWSIDSKKPVRTFTFEGNLKIENVHPGKKVVAFSPDGQFVLSTSSFVVTLRNVATGIQLRKFVGHDHLIVAISFSPDGKHVLSVSKDGTLILWSTNTGKQLQRFTVEHPDLSSAAFSPDGRYLLTGNWPRLADNALKPVGGSLKLWDVASGREVRTFTGHTRDVLSVAFSWDGRYGLSGGRDGIVRLWELATGEEVRTFTGGASWVGAVSFLPTDPNTVVTATSDGFRLWDVATGRQRQYEDYEARIGEIVGMNPVMGKDKDIYKMVFSPNGEFFLVMYFGHRVKVKGVVTEFEFTSIVKKVSTGQAIGGFFEVGKDLPSAVALSQQGQYVVAGMHAGDIRLWDVATGKTIWTVAGHDWKVMSVAFSPDGRYVLTGGGQPTTLKLWEVETGKLIKSFESFDDDKEIVGFGLVGALAFSQDGQQIRATSGKGLLLFDIETGQQERISQKVVSDDKFFTCSADGRYGLSGGEDREVKLWDLRFKRLLTVFRGHSSTVLSGAFSPDNRFVVTGSVDGTTRVWDPSTGVEVARLIGLRDGEWVVMTPEGYYSSSAKGDRYLNVRLGNRVSGIDRYRSTFYKPQVVEAALRLGNSRKALAQILGDMQPVPMLDTLATVEPPFLVIREPKNGAVVESATVDLAVHIEDRHRPITLVDLYVSGRKITGAVNRDITVRPKSGKKSSENSGFSVPQGKRQLDLTIPVSLEIGENVVEVVASNGFAEERKSIRLFLKPSQGSGDIEVMLPNLWILAIGVNDYQDPRIPSLSYAAADAKGMVSALVHQKSRLFREVYTRLITDHSDVTPTAANILDNLDFLKQAGQHDVVLLFIAGHGITDESGEFFFLPTDAVIQEDGKMRRSRPISWRDIQSTLDLPSKKLIFADTCHSADLGGKKKTRGVDNDRLVKELQSANAVIFTSSRGSELSQESETLGHGIFTYALLKGLSGGADLIKDKKISMKELDAYVSELVPKLTNGAQHPITITPDGYVNFPMAVLD